MLADVVALPPFWNKWSWPTVKPIVLGSLPGVVLGVFLHRSADTDLLRVLLGLISLAFVPYQVLQIVGVFSSTPRKLSPRIGGLVGAIAGFTSFISHAEGPPVAVYLLAQEIDKTTYRSSTVLIFTIINVFKFVPCAFLGMYTLETFWVDAIFAHFILLEAFVGVRARFFCTREIIFYSNLCHAIDYRYKVNVGWLERINFCFIRVVIISVFRLIKLLYFRCQAWQLKLALIARNS